MSDSSGLDVSKVISVLMENPALIAEISSLVKKETDTKPVESAPVASEKTVETNETSPTVTLPQEALRTNRAQLLGALKPYLSESRAKAIDSMMTIADIIGMMKTR